MSKWVQRFLRSEHGQIEGLLTGGLAVLFASVSALTYFSVARKNAQFLDHMSSLEAGYSSLNASVVSFARHFRNLSESGGAGSESRINFNNLTFLEPPPEMTIPPENEVRGGPNNIYTMWQLMGANLPTSFMRRYDAQSQFIGYMVAANDENNVTVFQGWAKLGSRFYSRIVQLPMTGAAGTSGSPGGTGAVGVTGVSGTTGVTGVTGTEGASGASGLAGAAGSAGTGGSAGSAATSGTGGSSGVSGVTGSAASTGTAGAVGGSAGASGGSAGATGASGGGGNDPLTCAETGGVEDRICGTVQCCPTAANLRVDCTVGHACCYPCPAGTNPVNTDPNLPTYVPPCGACLRAGVGCPPDWIGPCMNGAQAEITNCGTTTTWWDCGNRPRARRGGSCPTQHSNGNSYFAAGCPSNPRTEGAVCNSAGAARDAAGTCHYWENLPWESYSGCWNSVCQAPCPPPKSRPFPASPCTCGHWEDPAAVPKVWIDDVDDGAGGCKARECGTPGLPCCVPNAVWPDGCSRLSSYCMTTAPVPPPLRPVDGASGMCMPCGTTGMPCCGGTRDTTTGAVFGVGGSCGTDLLYCMPAGGPTPGTCQPKTPCGSAGFPCRGAANCLGATTTPACEANANCMIGAGGPGAIGMCMPCGTTGMPCCVGDIPTGGTTVGGSCATPDTLYCGPAGGSSPGTCKTRNACGSPGQPCRGAPFCLDPATPSCDANANCMAGVGPLEPGSKGMCMPCGTSGMPCCVGNVLNGGTTVGGSCNDTSTNYCGPAGGSLPGTCKTKIACGGVGQPCRGAPFCLSSSGGACNAGSGCSPNGVLEPGSVGMCMPCMPGMPTNPPGC